MSNAGRATMSPDDVITYIRQHPEELVSSLQCEHRTHQQSTVGSLQRLLSEYAKFGTDFRNEASVEWAALVTAKPVHFPFI